MARFYNADDLIEIVDVGSAELDPINNILTLNALGVGTSEDNEDLPNYSETPIFGALGLVAMPSPKNDSGGCEGLLLQTKQGPAFVGFRDTRTSQVYGQLQPGTTCLHSVGAEQSIRLLLNEEKRTAALLVKDSEGEDIGLIIDGNARSVSFFAGGHIVELHATDFLNIRVQSDAGTSNVSVAPQSVVIQSGNVGLGAAPTAATPAAYGVAGPVNTVSTSVFISP